jgi:flagellar biosynthesis regulator FlbT
MNLKKLWNKFPIRIMWQKEEQLHLGAVIQFDRGLAILLFNLSIMITWNGNRQPEDM